MAELFKWKQMQQVLKDPSLLFFNRAARATKLYKAGEFEPACEAYALAQNEMERMVHSRPTGETIATFFFNYARSSQSMGGAFCQSIRLFSQVLDASPKHERALDARAVCHNALGDFESALADLAELQTKFKTSAETATVRSWAQRVAEIKAEQRKAAHDVLGVERDADEAEVKKVYRKLCLNWHPDKHASSTEDQRERARHRFARIQAAYEKMHASGRSSSGFDGFGGYDFPGRRGR